MTGERAGADPDGRHLSDGGSAGCDAPTPDTAGEHCDPVTPDAAVERIRERATTVRDGELETALGKLEARGDLSETEREAVAGLADRLVEELLAVPESSLREAADAEDDRTVETALELFG